MLRDGEEVGAQMLWDTPAVRPLPAPLARTPTWPGSLYGHEYPLHLPGGSIGRGFVFGILSGRAMRGDLESAVGQRVLPVVCLYD